MLLPAWPAGRVALGPARRRWPMVLLARYDGCWRRSRGACMAINTPHQTMRLRSTLFRSSYARLDVNCLSELPGSMVRLVHLEELCLTSNFFATFPEFIMKVSSLKKVKSRLVSCNNVGDEGKCMYDTSLNIPRDLSALFQGTVLPSKENILVRWNDD